MADVGDIKSGSLAHQYYPGRLPHLRSPSLSSFHPSRTPRGGSTCRRGVGARTGTPSFAGTAYPSTHGDGVGLSRPFAAYVVSDRARSWNRPALGRCSPGLAATSVLPADTRGEGSLKQAAGRRMAWAGVIGAGPLQVGTRRRLWRHHGGPQQSRVPIRLQAAAASSATRLGALLPLPSCLLPVRSHLSLAL